MPATIKNINDVAPYSGAHAIAGVRFRPVRAALGITAWGMSVIELDAHCTAYPEHDHAKDGQEEVYLVLDGAATFVAGGEERAVSRGDLVHVPPDVKRKFITTDSPVSLLALGNTPGKAYVVR
jgi:mannose-6-phosphate isomerase-like protein (cupin superfamily)